MTINSEQQRLLDYLEMMHGFRKREFGPPPEGLKYHGMEDFLLQHGQWFDVDQYDPSYPKGAPENSLSFGNAVLLGTTHGLRYIEGMAITPFIPMPVHHAWNIASGSNDVIDNTWLNTGSAYFGVEFSLGRAEEAIWFADATVLDCWTTDFAFYHRKWEGEDYSLEWKRSRIMDAMRIKAALDSQKKGRRRAS